MKAKNITFFASLLTIGAASFAQSFESSTRSVCEYGSGEVLTAVSIRRGTVVHISTVDMGASSSTLALGGVVGGATVAALTNDKDWRTRSALTALGAAAGVKVAERTGQTEGLRFLVEDKQGNIIALVAEADQCAREIAKGDAVFVAKGQRTRLIRE